MIRWLPNEALVDVRLSGTDLLSISNVSMVCVLLVVCSGNSIDATIGSHHSTSPFTASIRSASATAIDCANSQPSQ